MRGQKGITLVALIITVIVLLILAVVTIVSVSDGGIIQHATNATTTHKDNAAAENNTISNYVLYLDNQTAPYNQTVSNTNV